MMYILEWLKFLLIPRYKVIIIKEDSVSDLMTLSEANDFLFYNFRQGRFKIEIYEKNKNKEIIHSSYVINVYYVKIQDFEGEIDDVRIYLKTYF